MRTGLFTRLGQVIVWRRPDGLRRIPDRIGISEGEPDLDVEWIDVSDDTQPEPSREELAELRAEVRELARSLR